MGPVLIVILVLLFAVIGVGYWLWRKEKTGKKNVTEDAVTFRDRFNRVRHMNDEKEKGITSVRRLLPPGGPFPPGFCFHPAR